MIDFAALALGPGIAAFGRPVTVTLPPARPARAPFDATGVWTSRPTDIQIEGGESLNTRVITLGIKLSLWLAPPEQGTQVEVPAAGSLPAEGTFWVDDIDLDGQGGATLTLKRRNPLA